MREVYLPQDLLKIPSLFGDFGRGVCVAGLFSVLVTATLHAFPPSTLTPWVPLGMGGNGYIDDIDIMPAPATSKSKYFVATGVDSGGAWISFDEGESFVPVGGMAFTGTAGALKANGNVIRFVRSDPTGRTILVGTDSKEIFRSSASAVGELVLTQVLAASEPLSVFQTAPSNNAVIYAGGGNRRVYYKGKIGISDSQPVMWKSTDSGATWSVMATIPIPGGSYGTVCNLAVVPNDANTVFAATDQGLFKYNTGTSSWGRIGNSGSNPLPHRAVFGIAIDPASTTGQILYCTMMPYDDMEAFLFADEAPEPTNRGGIYKSTDGGTNWTKLNVGFTPPVGDFNATGFFYNVQVSADNSNRVYATYGAPGETLRGVLCSTDAGSTWALRNAVNGNATLDYQAAFCAQSLAVYSKTPGADHVFVSGDVASNYKSTNSGTLFKSYTSSVSSGAYRGWGLEGGRGKYISTAASDPDKMFYADSDRGFWTSANRGLSWTLRLNPDNATQGKGRGIIADPDNGNIVYAWSAFRTIDFGVPSRTVPHFFKSSDGGATFPTGSPFSGVTENNVWDLALDPTVLASGSVSSGRTIYVSAGSKARYQVQVVLDTSAKTYDLYVDGDRLATGYAFQDSGAGAISKVEFQIPGGTAATSFFVDNVGIYPSFVDQAVVASLSTFESDTTGGSPSGWTTSGSGSAVVAEIPHSSVKMLKVATATTGANVTTGLTLSSALSGAMVLVKFDVIFEDTTTSKRCVIYGGSSNKATSVVFVNDVLKAYNGGSLPALSEIENRYVHRGVYKTTDGGSTWSDISAGLPGGAHLSHLRLDPNSATTLFANDERVNGGVYKKVASAAWTKVFPVSSTSFASTASIATAASGGNTIVYAGVSQGADTGLWKSGNGGTTWSRVLDPATNTTLFPDGLPSDLVFPRIEAVSGSEVVVATSYGVLRSTDTGSTWAWFNESIPCASTEFIRTVNDTVKRYYTGMRTEGFAVRYEMPAAIEFKRRESGVWVDDWRNIPVYARVGSQAYIDAAWSVDSLPTSGLLWLLTTSMDDYSNAVTPHLQVKTASASTVYIAVPTGATPTWLKTADGYTKLSTTISVSPRNSGSAETLEVWSYSLAANTGLNLGGLSKGNTVAPVNYLVFVKIN